MVSPRCSRKRERNRVGVIVGSTRCFFFTRCPVALRHLFFIWPVACLSGEVQDVFKCRLKKLCLRPCHSFISGSLISNWINGQQVEPAFSFSSSSREKTKGLCQWLLESSLRVILLISSYFVLCQADLQTHSPEWEIAFNKLKPLSYKSHSDSHKI